MDQPNQPPRRESSSTERLITVEQQLYYFRESVDKQLKEICNDVKEIKEQTTKTNGRVNGLEDWKSKITYSKDGFWTAVKPIWSLVSAIIIGVLVAIIVAQINSKPISAEVGPRMFPHFDQAGVHDADCYWTGEGKPSCIPIQSNKK